MGSSCSTICSDYSAFAEETRKVFDHPVRGRETSQHVLRLRQGSLSVASFAVEFSTLAAESGWNEEALQGVFLNALSGDIKDQLTSREESSDLDHLISLCGRIKPSRSLSSWTPEQMRASLIRSLFVD